MKLTINKIFIALNVFFIAVQFAVLYTYKNIIGGYWMKGFCSLIFVILGVINFAYCIIKSKKTDGFAGLILLGLILGMVADVVLELNFIFGALVFALGHLAYLVAYSVLHKPEKRDLIYISVIFAATLILLLLPIYDFGVKLMFYVAIAYGVIISFMLGKSLANAVRFRKRTDILLFIGSLLFYISDFMLLMVLFGTAFSVPWFLCFYTYWPGQILISHTIYHYSENL